MRNIILDENNIVISVRYGSGQVEGEIQSEFGELGQLMKKDGTFVDIPKNNIQDKKDLTNADLAQMISNLEIQLILAGVI